MTLEDAQEEYLVLLHADRWRLAFVCLAQQGISYYNLQIQLEDALNVDSVVCTFNRCFYIPG